MSDKIINILKLKLVAAELAKIGITDREKVVAIAARTTVTDTGAIVGLKADGNRGVGTADNYEMSVADVAQDMGEITTARPDRTETARAGVVDPSKAGFNLSQAFAAARSDPHLYDELMKSLAPKPMRVF